MFGPNKMKSGIETGLVMFQEDGCNIVFMNKSWVGNNLTFNKCWDSSDVHGVDQQKFIKSVDFSSCLWVLKISHLFLKLG